jgi:FkbM family methyltransferase
MSMLKRLALATVGRTPAGLRSWVYRHPLVWNPLAKMIGGLVPANESTVVDVRVGPNAGLKLAIDRSTPKYYWLDPNYEAPVVGVLREWVRPGMVVADVGAHIGFMTLALARMVQQSGKVLSVEPSPVTHLQLKRNVELNELGNVTVLQAAVSDTTGEAPFAIQSHATTSHLATASEMTGTETVLVPVVRLDDLVFGHNGLEKMDVVKIDVEGHEGGVLRGAARILKELRPKLLIEAHTPAALADCLRQLQSANYEISTVTPNAYYAQAIADPSAAEREPSRFSINHLRCVPR